VKAVSDLFAPVSGRVDSVNADLADSPESVNEDCYGQGWMLVVEASDPAELEVLLDAAAYRKHVDERSD
jgi:glycine cleavage system H protein